MHSFKPRSQRLCNILLCGTAQELVVAHQSAFVLVPTTSKAGVPVFSTDTTAEVLAWGSDRQPGQECLVLYHLHCKPRHGMGI